MLYKSEEKHITYKQTQINAAPESKHIKTKQKSMQQITKHIKKPPEHKKEAAKYNKKSSNAKL